MMVETVKLGWPHARELTARLPSVRGRIMLNANLAPITWFRVGGPAEVLFAPADELDLAEFLSNLERDIDVTILGIGSNVLIRDFGVSGVVIRLGRGFSDIVLEADYCVRVGCSVPDKKLAAFTARNELAGFSFFQGIPGTLGGALRMNAGANGVETAEKLIEVNAVDRAGIVRRLTAKQMGFGYRHSGVGDDVVFTSAMLQGAPGNEGIIRKEMAEVQSHRENSQPIRERTGGSTFKNPLGESAWKLIDRAGCRGLVVGGAEVSEKHCNFLINTGNATAGDLERLGEIVRARVMETCGVQLAWEIKRIGSGPQLGV